jgi:hypothetical protein
MEAPADFAERVFAGDATSPVWRLRSATERAWGYPKLLLEGPAKRLVIAKPRIQGDPQDRVPVEEQANGRSFQPDPLDIPFDRLAELLAKCPMEMEARGVAHPGERAQGEIAVEMALDVDEDACKFLRHTGPGVVRRAHDG